jgi:hypothetical protein
MSNEPTQSSDDLRERPTGLDTEDEHGDTVDGSAVNADLTAIRALWERILPDTDCRMMVANALADAIVLAHQIGTNRWAITVGNQRHIRLNVGSYVVAEVGKNYLWLAVDTSILRPDALPRLQRLHKWNSYTKLPNEMGGYVRCHELGEVLPLVREAAQALVTRSAQQVTRIRSTVSDAHVAGVVAYARCRTRSTVLTSRSRTVWRASTVRRLRWPLTCSTGSVVTQVIGRIGSTTRLIGMW